MSLLGLLLVNQNIDLTADGYEWSFFGVRNSRRHSEIEDSIALLLAYRTLKFRFDIVR